MGTDAGAHVSNRSTPSEAFPSERLSEVLDSAPAIVWLWEPEAGCTYVSSAWTRITRRPVAHAWGEGWAARVHPDDAAIFAACRTAMRANERYAAEYRLRRADGSYATVNDQGYPLEPDGAVGPFLGAALEVTAQREAEALVRASDALLSAVAEGMGVALGVKDRAGRYLIANDAMSALLGVHPGGAIGRTDRDLGIGDWAHRDDQDRAVLGGGDVRAEDQRDEATFLTTKSPLRGDGDAIDGVIVVGTDISTERARRGRAERLDRLTRALGASTSVREVADTVFVEALEALETPFGALGLLRSDGRTIEITRLRGFDSKRADWRSLVIDGDDIPITRAVRDRAAAFYASAEDLLTRFPHLRGRLLAYEGRAALPLRSGEEILGVLYVAFTDPQRFDDDRQAYYLAVADRIGQALERARLFDVARSSDDQTRALQAVTADLGAAMTVEEVQLVTTRAACAAVGADACMLAIADLDASTVVYAETDAYPADLRALLPTTLERDSSPVADVLAHATSVVFGTNAALLANYPHLGELTETLPFAARAFVPVGAPGVPTGVLIASSVQEGRFDTERVRLLESIAGQCGQALQRAVLHRDTRAATDRASALQTATLAIAEATTLGEAVEPAVSFALDLVVGDIGALLVDAESRRLSVAHEIGAPPVLLERWSTMPVDRIAMVEGAVESRRGQWRTIDELRAIDPGVAAVLDERGIASVGVLPLISGGGVLGVIGLGCASAPPDRLVRDTLEAFAERVGAAIYRARLLETERRTRHQLERTLSRLSRLQSVSDAISQAVPVDEVADRALTASIDALGALGGGVYLAEGETLRLIAAEGVFTSAVGGRLDTVPVDAEMAMCASFASGTVNWIPTYREWQQRHAFGASMFEGIARSTIAIPFSLEDRVLGVMTLVFTGENGLDRPERRLARTIGYQAAVALERSLLYEREMARSRRTEQIQHLIAELAGSADAAGIAAILTSTALQVLGADAAAVVLVDEGADAAAEVVAASGFPGTVLDALAHDVRAPVREAVTSGRPAFLRTENAVAERYPDLADTLGSALAELPLSAGGEILGALLVRFAQPQAFDLEQIDLLAAVASEAAQATQRARVRRREREISRTLQDSLLPDEPTSSWNGARVTTWYSAGTQHLDVGGDWYDAIELPDGRLAVSIGDVVGRGLRAAAAMGQLRSALRGIALEMRGPASTLEALNRFAARTPGTELATVAYGEYDPTTGAFVYACAGHPPPVACIGGRAVVLEAGRSPLLAAGYDGPRTEATCLLPPHATLVLYTDGLIERRDEPFHRGIDRLRTTLEHESDGDPADLVDALITAVLGTRERTDDAALLVLRTGFPIPFAMTLDDSPEGLRPLRHRLQAWLALRGCPPDDADAVVLAVNEAAANAIEHGYRHGDGPVEVTGDVVDHALQLSIVDHGRWRAAEPDPARGRGLPLMRTLMDDVAIEELEPGTRIVLRREVPVGADAPALAGSDGRG
jgi:GAF domain-containing protein/PAS domain-containing protein/anti-sigma regulatory factor (Ser/Thr protein kinase)